MFNRTYVSKIKHDEVLTVAFAMLLSALGSTDQAYGQSSKVKQVLEAERLGCLACQYHDLQGVRDFLMDDYTLTDSKGTVTTKQDDLDDFLKDRVRYTAFHNANMKVRLYGNTAVVTGQTHVEGTVKGSVFIVNVQFTDTLVLLHGRWRLAAGHVSRLPAA